ncbi:MAG: GDSL-type esterase/lipase family protein [Eubacteriales bacterium]|nr:GDSL-type esterase/lipase family protein [Eubacteriales bacterium]
MDSKLYYILAYFILYSFLGWCLEVAFNAVTSGRIVNRGFLNGPLCPIYGFGMTAVILILTPVKDDLLLLFFGGAMFATLIELAGGFILLKLFSMRWWDYTNEPFNLGGYICLRFSAAWGICILFAMKIIHPVVELNVYLLDGFIGHFLLIAAYLVFAADLAATVMTITKLNKRLSRLNEFSHDIRSFSDELTDKIGKTAFDANIRYQRGRIQAALGMAELEEELDEIRDRIDTDRARKRSELRLRTEEIRDRVEESFESIFEETAERIRKHKHFGYGRLLRAFPGAKHARYNEELRRLIMAINVQSGETEYVKSEEKKNTQDREADDVQGEETDVRSAPEDAQKSSKTGTVICFGDSNTYGYDPYTGSRYPSSVRWTDIIERETGIKTVNAGLNGRQIPHTPYELSELISYLDKAAEGAYDAPVMLWIMLGTNDIQMNYGYTAEKAVERMRSLLTELMKHRAVREQTVKLCVISPAGVREGSWSDSRCVTEIDRLRGLLQKLCGELGLCFADLGGEPIELGPDGDHFTPAGHRRAADFMIQTLVLQN